MAKASTGTPPATPAFSVSSGNPGGFTRSLMPGSGGGSAVARLIGCSRRGSPLASPCQRPRTHDRLASDGVVDWWHAPKQRPEARAKGRALLLTLTCVQPNLLLDIHHRRMPSSWPSLASALPVDRRCQRAHLHFCNTTGS